MFNLARLRVLVELERRQTLAAVADVLQYSTSAVSQQIRQLEKEVGVDLVRPVGRRLVLTEQGQILVSHAEKILAQVEEATNDVLASTDQPRGTVTVAGFQTAALTLVPLMLEDLHKSYPQLTIVFSQGEPAETMPALMSGEVDVVITESYPGVPLPASAKVSMTHLMSDPLWLTMSPQLADKLDHRKNLISQLQHEGWAMENTNSAPRTWVVDECRRSGFEPRIVCTSEDLVVQLGFVSSGNAVALIPELALLAHPADVRRFPTQPVPQKREIYAASRELTSGDRSVKIVIDALHRAVSKLATVR